ncbi:hypothetical protein [Haloarcula halophila]|uniref:hypothetical protein n=1 Tax=Haloarcula TaxID=2237 RepID=UPI0023E36409|nr:hypothetical protein [Halomicroarcula sp. DFY41]
MGIGVVDSLKGGAQKLASPNGLGVLGAFVALAVANVVITQTIFLRSVERALSRTGVEWSEVVTEAPASAPVPMGAGIGGPEQFFPEAIGVSLPIAVALWVLTALLAEVVRVLGIRVFASDESGVPSGLFDSIGFTTLNSLIASLVATVVVMLGAVLLLIPGIVLAILLEFVRQEVALNDANPFEALSNSYGHVKSNFLAVFALGVILFTVLLLVGVGAGTVASGPSLPGLPSFVSTVLTTGVTVYTLAVMTDAYQQAVDGETGGATSTGSDAPSDTEGSPL